MKVLENEDGDVDGYQVSSCAHKRDGTSAHVAYLKLTDAYTYYLLLLQVAALYIVVSKQYIECTNSTKNGVRDQGFGQAQKSRLRRSHVPLSCQWQLQATNRLNCVRQ